MKHARRNFYLLAFTCLLGLSFTGCATTHAPTFYQLEEPVSMELRGVERGLVVGLELLNIPAYLDRPQIVTRIADHKLFLSGSHMWAEPLKKSITRVVCVNLSNQLNSNRVFRLPRRDRKLPLDFKVTLAITRFDGRLGDEATLNARWSLFDQNNKPLLTRVSIISQSIDDQDYDTLIIALNRALFDLSREIAGAINHLQSE